MTKKEKKELALKIKAANDARHALENPKPEKEEIISKEQMALNNRSRYRRRTPDKDDEMYWQLRRRYRD